MTEIIKADNVVAVEPAKVEAPAAVEPTPPAKPKSKLELKGEASRKALNELQNPASAPAVEEKKPAVVEKPAAEPEDEGDEDGSEPASATASDDSPQKRRISKKTEDEIERRVAERSDALRKEMMDWMKIAQAPAPAAVAPTPAAEQKKYNLDALMNDKFTEELPSYVSDQIAEALKPYQQFQVQQQLNAVGTEWASQRAPLETSDAEFKQSREFLLNNQRALYKQQYPGATDSQIESQLAADESAMVAQAKQTYRTPQAIAMHIKALAYNNGFAFVPPAPVAAPAPDAKPQPTLTEQRKIKEDAPLSLNGVGAGGAIPGGEKGVTDDQWKRASNRDKIKMLPGIKEALAASARK